MPPSLPPAAPGQSQSGGIKTTTTWKSQKKCQAPLKIFYFKINFHHAGKRKPHLFPCELWLPLRTHRSCIFLRSFLVQVLETYFMISF